MDSVLGMILLQAFYYSCVMMITVFILSFMLKGFFWKYIKVRMSFGKLVLVKLRSTLRDHYKIGWVEDGFLCYRTKDESGKYVIRTSIPKDRPVFYKSLAITFIDIDEETNGICTIDYSSITGFDAKKFSDLYTRCLMRPSINSTKETIILVLLILILVSSLASIYFGYKNTALTQQLATDIPNYFLQAKGTITANMSAI